MSKYRLNSHELTAYMVKDPFIRKFFGGVLAIDELEYIVPEPKIYIINTDPRHEAGEHWFSMFLFDTPEHFDSSGYKPKPNVANYLMFHGPEYLFNTRRVQSFLSETCRVFCLFYCYFRCRGYSFSDVMNMFSDNLLMNEAIVKHFYEETK